MACVQAALRPELPQDIANLLYCELGRVVARRLVLSAESIAFQPRGRFWYCAYLRLIGVDSRAGQPHPRWVFEVFDDQR